MSIDPLKLAALICSSVALTSVAGAVAFATDTPFHRAYFRYVSSLERRMRTMFIELRGLHIVLAQAAAMLLVIVLSIAAHKPLANALRASPSAGRALAMIQPVTPVPLDREIELVLREMRVGSTLEQALGNLSARVRSFQLDAAMSGLLIGRQTGGNVPEILDGAAQTLREIARLQGVLRSKTAEGRAQANVLAVFPLVLIFTFDLASPGYFKPLTEGAVGVTVMMLAIAMWIVSVIMTRRIMAVEL
jgi:Flp pilus assembly protein TadB